VAGEPDGATAYEQIQRAFRLIDARPGFGRLPLDWSEHNPPLVVVVPPAAEAAVRQGLTDSPVAGMVEVAVSPWVPDDLVMLFNRHELDVRLRQTMVDSRLYR